MRSRKLIGRRIIKTGISVFITAMICLQLKLPAEFAIIAAIVTIEPTAADSIRKGMIRFPASAIGAALAVTFVSFWGETAMVYTLAAMLTIFLCQKLKLQEGILVATLTAVAMVPDIDGHYLITFLSRLGTTTIGLTVSSFVNFFILPAKFTPLMKEKLQENFMLASQTLGLTMDKILKLEKKATLTPLLKYNQLRNSTEKVNEFLTFQEKEWKYHKIKISEFREFYRLKKINISMQKLVLHLGNLQYVNEPGNFSTIEKVIIQKCISSIQTILTDKAIQIPAGHFQIIKELDEFLKKEANQLTTSQQYYHHFTTKRIVYFELLSIHDSLEEMQNRPMYIRKRG